MKLLVPRRKLLLGAAAGICAPAIIRAQQLTTTFAGPGAPGGQPVLFTPTANPAGLNVSTITATFSGVAIGSPGANDLVVMCANSVSDIIASVTCNGVNMPRQIREATGVSGLDIYAVQASTASVTGLATTTFVLTGNSTSWADQTIQVGKVSHTLTPTPTTGSAFATSINVTTIVASGVAVIACYGEPPTAMSGLSGAVLDFTTNDATGAGTLFTLQTPSNGTVSQTAFPANVHFAYAAWGP